MDFKASIRRILVLALATLTITIGVNATAAYAKDTKLKASSEIELAQLVRAQLLEGNTEFTVDYDGKKALSDIIGDNAFEFLSYMLVTPELDDPATTDDADYLVANINVEQMDWSYDSNSIYFYLPSFETLKERDYVNNRTTEILNSLNLSGMSNLEKVCTIYDTVCQMITYDKESAHCDSAYGAMHDGKALCNSYSLCMYKLLEEAGIPCKYIGGKAGTGRDAGGHAWNMVMLGNKWYYIDATWDDDDENGETTTDYFLKGSSDFDECDPDQKHTLDDAYKSAVFKKDYPVAKQAFVYGSNDENDTSALKSRYLGNSSDVPQESGEDEQEENDEITQLVFDNIVVGPEDGKMTIKKGKEDYVACYMDAEIAELIDKASYKLISGKKVIKITDFEGGYSDYDEYCYLIGFKGKKAGNAKLQMKLKLVNGDTITLTYKIKVKK